MRNLRRPLPLVLASLLLSSLTLAASPAAPAAPPAPSYTAATASTDYALTVFSGFVQRWNPCSAIHYRVDARLGGSLAEVNWAIGQLSRATGLHFVYDGPAKYSPQPGKWAQPAELVISFAHPAGQTYGSGYLSGGSQVGYGGFQSYYTATAKGKITSYRIIKGFVVIDASRFAHSSIHVQHAVLLHELGHAVGMEHARNASEIMYPTLAFWSPNTYSPSDRAGLARVGRPAGCIANP